MAANFDQTIFFNSFRPPVPEELNSSIADTLLEKVDYNKRTGKLTPKEGTTLSTEEMLGITSQWEAFKKQPLSYGTVYNIQKNINQSNSERLSEFSKKSESEKKKRPYKEVKTEMDNKVIPPKLNVTLPAGLKLGISAYNDNQGKIELVGDIKNMSAVQLQELDEFLVSNGMHGIDFSAAQEKLRDKLKSNLKSRVYAAENKFWFGSEEDYADVPKYTSNVKADVSKANKKIQDKLITGFNKRYGKNYTMSSSLLNGLTTYKIYKGKMKDKKGNRKAPQFLIETSVVKIRGVPVLCVGYATADGEKIGVQEAETIVESIKECGYKFMDLGGVPNDDERPFIAVKGHREGIVSANTTLNSKHFFEGLEAASSKIADDDSGGAEDYNVNDWKANATWQMRHNKGTARNEQLMDLGDGSKYFYDFSDKRFDGEYTRDINRENQSGNGPRMAAAAIAATYIVDEAFYNDKIKKGANSKDHPEDIKGFAEREAEAKKAFIEEFDKRLVLEEFEKKATLTPEEEIEKREAKEKVEAFNKGIKHFNSVEVILNNSLKAKGDGATSRDIDFDDVFKIYKAVKERKIIEIEAKYEEAYRTGGPQAASATLNRYNTTGTRGLSAASTRVEKKYKIGLRRVDAYSGEYKGSKEKDIKEAWDQKNKGKGGKGGTRVDYDGNVVAQESTATQDYINELEGAKNQYREETRDLQGQIRELKDQNRNLENTAAEAKRKANEYKDKYKREKDKNR